MIDIDEEMNLFFLEIDGNFGKMEQRKLTRSIKKGDKNLKPGAGLLINLKNFDESEGFHKDDEFTQIVNNINYIAIVKSKDETLLEILDEYSEVILVVKSFIFRDYALDWLKEVVDTQFLLV